ncbi:hypothetical protein Bca4012_060164 [Brassica carinata]
MALMGVMRPELVMKSILLVVIYGLKKKKRYLRFDHSCYHQYWNQPKGKSYYLVDGYAHLSSGLACGLAGLSAVMAIGIVGDAGVRVNAQQPKFFVE